MSLNNPKRFLSIENTARFVLILSFLLMVSVVIYMISRIVVLDDAYIYLRYVHSLINGKGFAWDPYGAQVYGSTSISYIFVLALFKMFLPISNTLLLKIVSSFSSVLSVAALFYVCTRLAKSTIFRKRWTVTCFIVPSVVLQPIFAYHSGAGMDTMFSFFMNTFLIAVTIRLLKTSSFWNLTLVATSAYLAYLARVDNLIYAVLFPSLFILFLIQDKKFHSLVVFLVSLIFLLLVDFFCKYLIFNGFWPLAFEVKKSGFYLLYAGAYKWNPLKFLFEFFAAAIPFIIILILCFRKKYSKILFTFLIPAGLTFAYYFHVVQIMGYHARFYYPALPYVIVVAFILLDGFLFEREGKMSAPIKKLVFLWIIISLISPTVYMMRYTYRSLAEAKINTKKTSLPMLQWWEATRKVSRFASLCPKRTVLAASEIGYLGAKNTNLEIVDLSGLNQPYFARNGFSIHYLMAKKPDVIWLPHDDYVGMREKILSDVEFKKDYLYYQNAFNYGLAIRRSARSVAQIKEALNTVWKETYPGYAIENFQRHK